MINLAQFYYRSRDAMLVHLHLRKLFEVFERSAYVMSAEQPGFIQHHLQIQQEIYSI